MSTERIHTTTKSTYYTFHGLPGAHKICNAVFDDDFSPVWPCGAILNANPDGGGFVGKVATPSGVWAVIATLYVRSSYEFAIDEFGTPADITDKDDGDRRLIGAMCEIEPKLFTEDLMVHRVDRELNVLVRRAEYDADEDLF